MYYTNITNPELLYFKEYRVPNFTISLTDLLTSPLFECINIMGNIYKIFPLFYTSKILSTNTDDKILENQCIICKRNTKETYLTFIRDENEKINDYKTYAEYFDIKDRLSTNEFNGVVSVIRDNYNKTENIQINTLVNGQYGEYLFDINDTDIVDEGIVVTAKTLQANPKVKLTNPVFKHANYLLKLKVLHYDNLNVLPDAHDDFIVVDILEIPLTVDEWVYIPFTSIQSGYIISFDAEIIINYNSSILTDFITDILVDGTRNIIQKNSTLELCCFTRVNNREVLFTHNDIFDWVLQTGATMTFNDDGTTTLGTDGSRTGFIWANLKNTPREWNNGDFTYDLTIDIDVINTSDYHNRILFYEKYKTGSLYQEFRLQQGHNTIIKKGSTYTHYVDNEEQGTIIKDLTEPLRIGFGITNNTKLTFENFTITGNKPLPDKRVNFYKKI